MFGAGQIPPQSVVKLYSLEKFSTLVAILFYFVFCWGGGGNVIFKLFFSMKNASVGLLSPSLFHSPPPLVGICLMRLSLPTSATSHFQM